MPRFVQSIQGWDDQKRVWVFYEGTQTQLQEMREWCEQNFGCAVEFGTQDLVRMVDFRISDCYQMAFVFSNANDAMRFKLSW